MNLTPFFTMTPNARQLPGRSLDAYPAVNPTSIYLDDNYSFDANGNVLSIVDNDGDARNTTRDMGYDDLDRLTVARGIWDWAYYTYDPLDNLRSNTLGASGFTYVYDANNRLDHLNRSGGGVYGYTYDARGNVTNDGRNAYTFTRANRLASITGKDHYQYDGHGRRMVVWRADNTAQVPVYGMSGKLIYTADNRGSGSGTTEVYLAGSVVAESVKDWTTNAVTVTYLHTDALGSPVKRTNASRGVVETTEYAPYGAPVNRPVDGVGYTGHVMDQSSGLIYMQQRYYDPQVGRFLSADPVQANPNSGANFSGYWYAANNPFRFIDPDGRKDKENNDPNNVRQPIDGTATPLWPKGGADETANPEAFNCVSATFDGEQGDPSDPSFDPATPKWDNGGANKVEKFREAGKALGSDEPNKLGDAVVYYSDLNHNGKADGGELKNKNVHYGTVIGVDSEGNTIRVKSKEGDGPYVEHHPRDQNAEYGKDREYFRK